MTLLRRISGYAAERGVIVSAVTNAFWAATAEEAVTVLRSVPAIQMLAISTDVYHQRSIPFERVKNAILAARDLGIPYNIAVCTEDTDDPEYKQIVAALAAVTPPETIATAITFRAGRALERVAELKYRMTNTPPVSACAAGSSPIVFPSGRVVACIGPVIDLPTKHPLLLGSLRDSTLETILDRAECNSILHAIRVWGPRKLIALASEAGLDQYLPREYVEGSMCQACYSLMASRQIRHFLHALSQNVSFVEKVAYARAYYLKETQMVSMCTKAM